MAIATATALTIAALGLGAGAITASAVESRKSRKAHEQAIKDEAAREEARLLKEEKTLSDAQKAAGEAVISERQKKRLKRGRASTILSDKAIAPNLARLAQARKRELGTGA